MISSKITALAHPNIAFIKYWGNRDDSLRLPANGSISMNLADLNTRTSVSFDGGLSSDQLSINNQSTFGPALERVSQVLDLVRCMSGNHQFASVESSSNFPTGAGMASSASAFAALALAASHAAGLDLSQAALSRLARRGSGSACRSVPGGFVEWAAGEGDADSYAASFAPASHWDLVDCIALISPEHKTTGSTRGNSLAATSPLQSSRVADSPRRLDICRQAILQRDFMALAHVAELDSNLLHAVMMTSIPGLFYWQPATLQVMLAVREARENGLPVFYTVDAGPNVHVLAQSDASSQVENLIRNIPGVQDVCISAAGGPARIV